MAAAVAAIASLIGSVASSVAAVVGPIVGAISAAIGPVVATISSVVGSITAALGSTIQATAATVTKTVGPLLAGLKNGIATIAANITKAAEPILLPIKEGLQLVHDKLAAVDAFIGEKLAIVKDVTKVVDYIATVKILTDLVKGQASIMDVIGKIAEGNAFKTAQAIAELTRSIAALGVNIVDRIDNNWKLLKAEFTSFEDRFRHNLEERVGQTKAQILAKVTPKITELGRHQQALNRTIARLARHIEDETWFAAMLLKVMP